MQVPIRKPGKYTFTPGDPYITATKERELKDRLDKLRGRDKPRAIDEVKRLAEFGDFSDNPGYSLAKGRLRKINQEILDLEKKLAGAIIVRPRADATAVEIGHRVTVRWDNDQEKTYEILGSSETDPAAGVISHLSPIGLALIGKSVGDTLEITLKNNTMVGTVLRIE